MSNTSNTCIPQNVQHSVNPTRDPNLIKSNTFVLNDVKILYHNVYGLSQDDLDENLDYYSQFHFFASAETWLDEEDELFFEGYRAIPYPRPDKNVKAWRGSGGMYVFIRHSILDGVEILHNRKDLVAWFRFKKEFFGWNSDIYVASCYIAPPNSPHLDVNAYMV